MLTESGLKYGLGKHAHELSEKSMENFLIVGSVLGKALRVDK